MVFLIWVTNWFLLWWFVMIVSINQITVFVIKIILLSKLWRLSLNTWSSLVSKDRAPQSSALLFLWSTKVFLVESYRVLVIQLVIWLTFCLKTHGMLSLFWGWERFSQVHYWLCLRKCFDISTYEEYLIFVAILPHDFWLFNVSLLDNSWRSITAH